MDIYKIGIDIGSTTIKMAAVRTSDGQTVMSCYRRHQARIKENLCDLMQQLCDKVGGDAEIAINLTGSVGMGIAEKYSLPFIQEVVAAACYLRMHHPDATTMIDIGGEDAKMVFLADGQPTDLRMNGNCAGGTGAFIDQMAVLLNVTPTELGTLAEHHTRIYPIASRCGVFCKTDIQNLIARNVPREDIAASIFHAVAVQTVVTLAHGHEITAPVLLCGGPLTFIPALRHAFAGYLQMPHEEFILPENANLITACGAALSATDGQTTAGALLQRLGKDTQSTPPQKQEHNGMPRAAGRLEPIFGSSAEYEEWKHHMSAHMIRRAPLPAGSAQAFIGIDSGSTTTKIVALDHRGQMLFSYYHDNNGNPIRAVEEGLRRLQEQCREAGTELTICGSCSTGYGEDLIKAAFRLNSGIVETMAHYMAAHHINSDVSFILDIGGQDMKAIFVDNGAISRIEVNEACSSGCGSFISTFAQSLGSTVEEFAGSACSAPSPCDLGTRCTVFMNSKVKQVLREGASVADIAAGLSYSVIKNCLYKVLRLKDTSALGSHIVVQGGTMRNDSVVRALERLTSKKVFRSDCPELMGALGCALYAMQTDCTAPTSLHDMAGRATYEQRQQTCHGCENQCAVTRYRFGNGNIYYSGNRCEKTFSNRGAATRHGANAYEKKRALLFGRTASPEAPLMTVGIPRCLNMYEEYPFWHTLLTACNLRVCLSEVSDFTHYERCAGKVMSDNICFPAKLVHSHIDNLIAQGVDRILMPFVVFEQPDSQMQNSYNCPVVTGYSQVIRSVQAGTIPIDTPTISFKDKAALYKQCKTYLTSLGIKPQTIRHALQEAIREQERFGREMAAHNETLLAKAKEQGQPVILLAGRPYHADELIQHKAAEMTAALGACVLTDDIVRGKSLPLHGVQYLSQWAFTNRIMKSAQWAAMQGDDVQYMQLTSFGCGPDAFLTDEIQALLRRHGKNLTLLKIDDVNNTGSLKLRVRSLMESLRTAGDSHKPQQNQPQTLPPYTAAHRRRKIIIPFFTPFISPLLPSLIKLAGYDADCLPISDSGSADWGLRFSNNEVCYPATLIVGDIIKAFRTGAYNPDETCVAITQTGGQCRASNYLSLIRRALTENGYTNTPVIAVAPGTGIDNHQPGFKVNWLKILPAALATILYSDCIAKMYHAAVVRENSRGAARRLRDQYLSAACPLIENNRTDELYSHLAIAAADFDRICLTEQRPSVGIVGEIFLKFHPFAQKHVTDWLIERNIEVVYPILTDFFMQSFVNIEENKHNGTVHTRIPDFAIRLLHRQAQKRIDRANAMCSRFRYFTPIDNIFEKAEQAGKAITLSAQFGEGWLIAGETAALAAQGVRHIISMQPFGCIANQIVEKGIENRLKALYPGIDILSLDFDSSVSEVNITNRLLLFINNLTDKQNN